MENKVSTTTVLKALSVSKRGVQRKNSEPRHFPELNRWMWEYTEAKKSQCHRAEHSREERCPEREFQGSPLSIPSRTDHNMHVRKLPKLRKRLT